MRTFSAIMATCMTSLLILVGSWILPRMATSYGDGTASERWTRERIVAANVTELDQALRQMAKEREEVAAGLMEIGLNGAASQTRRRDAIVSLAQVASREVIGFCLSHLDLHLEGTDWDADDDDLKERPTRFALAKMGLAAVVPILEWVAGRDLTDVERADVAWILRQGIRTKVAVPLVRAFADARAGRERERLSSLIPLLPAR